MKKIIEKIECGLKLTAPEQLTILNFNALDLLEQYISDHPLCDEVEVKLFDLPDPSRKDILKLYISEWRLCAEAELKLFDLPEDVRYELFVDYLQFYSLNTFEAEKRLLELPLETYGDILESYFHGELVNRGAVSAVAATRA